MGWFIFWVAIGLLVAFVVWGAIEAKKQQAAGDAWYASQKAQEHEARAERDAYLAKSGFQQVAAVTIEGRSAWLALEGSGEAVRLVSYILGTNFSILFDLTLSRADIFEVSLVRASRNEAFDRKVTTPLVVNKKKSAIGRGLVGGLLLGPVGLVLGAASGIAPSSKIIQHESTVRDTRVVEGPPTLILAPRRPADPVLRVQFTSPEIAENWLYRIKVMLEERETAT